MNFAYYYNILQQIEKPTFVFERFENEEVIETSLANYQMYSIENEQNKATRKRLFSILVEKTYQCYKHNQVKDNNFVKFYDTANFYITYCNVALAKEKLIKTTELTNKINECDYHELVNLYKNLYKKLRLKGISELECGIYDISRKALNNCYFNITTTEKDYFTLEIIAVIHKIIA